MHAVEIEGGKGSAEALHLAERPTPEPGPGQVLIRVAAAGINRPDLLQRKGLYPPPTGASDVLGLEVSGHIAALGQDVSRWAEGDAVCALLPGGGYAEYALADAGSVLPVPKGVSLIEAAGLPETVFTVWANVFEIGSLKPGETLAVHGATSGIGVTALQMARAYGARVVATSRGRAKCEQALKLGADTALDSTAPDFAAALAEARPDVILDMVGRDLLATGLAALNPGGRLVLIAVQSGARAEVDLAQIMMKRLTLTGSTLRPRSSQEKARLARAVEETVWPWIEQGKVRPVIDRTFPLKDARAAHLALEMGGHVGKIVLTV
ncbi:NAD(P)H-quinone oxidoreductase [Brevundimonas sp. 2R-24]|uniref:NAD(P)H-quinone oxidoreductase n=1 Tax=Peiella sedimenti TaxID=3061083 RepID=A0ABT8SJR6_9CAUL|nr:NAD(P)H-quinone oxidoreductase [Caulobacteraceae bacterium XZ-24]